MDAFLSRYVPKDDGRAKVRRKPRTHPETKALKKAEAWQARIDSGRAESRAALAEKEGLTRARVTQVLDLLKLAPEIRGHILTTAPNGHRPLSERSLRPLIGLPPSQQLAQLKRLERVR